MRRSGLFHLKLYSKSQDLIGRSIETGFRWIWDAAFGFFLGYIFNLYSILVLFKSIKSFKIIEKLSSTEGRGYISSYNRCRIYIYRPHRYKRILVYLWSSYTASFAIFYFFVGQRNEPIIHEVTSVKYNKENKVFLH